MKMWQEPNVRYTQLAKIVVLMALPIIVSYAFVACLCREFGRAFRYAYLDAATEVDVAWRIWK